MKKRKILIALNHYEYPNTFMEFGVNMAKELNCQATLVGVEKIPMLTTPVVAASYSVMTPDPVTMGDVVNHAEYKLKQLELKAAGIYPDVNYAVEVGFLEPKLVELSEEEKPFMVVLEGTNDLNTLHEWFGTYETRLAENIEVPVLVVPQKEVWKTPKNIVYLMDINDSGVENMRVLSQIAGQTDADITVAVVSEEVKEKDVRYLTMIKTFRQLLQYEKMTYIQVFTDEAADSINNIMEDKNADWLAFQHKDSNLLQRIFNNYNTQRLLLQAEIPVLVF